MRICDRSDLTLFYLSLIRADLCLSTVQTVLQVKKVKEKQADCRICFV
jgi:hypothetical protein